MNRLICMFRGHQPVPAKIVDIWMAPGFGLQTVYEPDETGDHRACERCRIVLRGSA